MRLCVVDQYFILYTSISSGSYVRCIEENELVFVDTTSSVVKWCEDPRYRGVTVMTMDGAKGFIFSDCDCPDPYTAGHLIKIDLS